MASFDALLDNLTGDRPPRVWSLVVTMFGVMGQKGETEISGAVLNRAMALAGIKPEATRVALFRLKKDDWIAARKIGRSSSYSLTASGRSQTAAASPRIYHQSPLPQTAWLVLLPRAADIDPALQDSSVAVAPNIWVSTSPSDRAEQFSTPLDPTQPMPDWMIDRLVAPKLRENCTDLLHRLNRVTDRVATFDTLSPLERFVLNALIIHAWRRIILRVPFLPDHINAQAGDLVACREKVLHLVEAISLPSMAELKDAASDGS